MVLHMCHNPIRKPLMLKRLKIATIKDVAATTGVTAADGVGMVTLAAAVEVEVEAMTISASLWIRVGEGLGIEVVGMDRREGDEAGVELFHYLYDMFVSIRYCYYLMC